MELRSTEKYKVSQKVEKKCDTCYSRAMALATKQSKSARPDGTGTHTWRGNASAAQQVRSRIEGSKGDNYWRAQDFLDIVSEDAAAKALQRLEQEGFLQRVYAGLYYRTRTAFFGDTVPSENEIRARTGRGHAVHASGLSAAALLGLTTQVPARPELAISAMKAPKALDGLKVHVGRPKSREGLADTDGALLEFLRTRGKYSDLPPEQTIDVLARYLTQSAELSKLLEAAQDEPARVRATLGALLDYSKLPSKYVDDLKATFDSARSRYDFGRLRALPNATEWRAK